MFSISSMKRGWAALLGLALLLWGFAYAAGPVGVGSLPGGGSVVSDSDTGNGQAWGRSGGRTIEYHVNDPAGFSMLKFGIVNGTVPAVAFDGTVNPSEMMTFNSALSSLATGTVVFMGSASLTLATGGTYANLPTKFTMKFTRASNNAAIPVGFDSGGVSPGADVLATGDFKVNLIFEMLNVWVSPQVFSPVLDLYDSLPTIAGGPPSGNVGPVMTGVTTGFYYSEAAADMTVAAHDAHVTSLFNGLDDTKTRVQFMYNDWIPRWNGIQGQVQDVSTTLNNDLKPTLQQVQSQVQQLMNSLGNINTGGLATKNDTDSLKEMMFIILGVAPCPAQAPPGFCSSFKSLQQLGAATGQMQVSLDGILIGLNNANTALGGVATQSSVNALQTKIDDVLDAVENVSSAALDVKAVQIDSNDPKKLRWLVKVTRDGVMVGASLTRFMNIRTPGAAVLGNVMGNAVVVTLAPGLLDVTLDLVKNVTDGAAYLFEASLASGGVTLQGSTLNVTEKKGASPF